MFTTQGNYQPLFLTLGYTFKDQTSLKQSLTRESALQEGLAIGSSYQRMEFAGDAILKATLTKILCKRFPSDTPEQLHAKMQPLIANDGCMVDIGRQLQLEKYLIKGKGETSVTNKMYADHVEALLGAIHLAEDSSLPVTLVVEKLWDRYLPKPVVQISSTASILTASSVLAVSASSSVTATSSAKSTIDPFKLLTQSSKQFKTAHQTHKFDCKVTNAQNKTLLDQGLERDASHKTLKFLKQQGAIFTLSATQACTLIDQKKKDLKPVEREKLKQALGLTQQIASTPLAASC